MDTMTDTQFPRHRPGGATASSHRENSEALARKVQHVMVAVESILRAHPAGVSELGLIRALQAPPWSLLEQVDFSSPERLYPVHFLTFHSLYRLRDDLASGGEDIAISPLLIRLSRSHVVAGSGPPAAADKLREFYLDLDQYGLSEQTISQMMDDFWAGRPGPVPAEAEVRQAAAVLGFEQVPEQFDEVKYRFRRAVMQAHPDRGGRTEDVQVLNEAFGTLRVFYVSREA